MLTYLIINKILFYIPTRIIDDFIDNVVFWGNFAIIIYACIFTLSV